VAVIDAGHRSLRYVRLGHPPPLLRRPDGTVVHLDGGHQPGIGIAPQAAAVGTAELDAGSTLVLFTDGLVERPRRDLIESIAAAGHRLAALPPGDAASIADELAHLLDDEPEQRDDAVIVACTVRS
jgi:serine phosphatase RsbU (regulator of sigma subunit)